MAARCLHPQPHPPANRVVAGAATLELPEPWKRSSSPGSATAVGETSDMERGRLHVCEEQLSVHCSVGTNAGAGLCLQPCWPGLAPLHQSWSVQPCTWYIKTPSLSLRGAAKPEDEVTVIYVNSEHIRNLESLMLNHVKFCCYRDTGWRKENASITCIFQLQTCTTDRISILHQPGSLHTAEQRSEVFFCS